MKETFLRPVGSYNFLIKTYLIAIVFALISNQTIAENKPNIVVFFTDDIGYRDIGPFGGLTPTPHLDRMAAEGTKLTSFYVASVKCTPSRAALLTGCYASRIGMDGHVVYPGQSKGLNPNEVTIAEMLKKVGYRTACIGKWHLGDQPELLPPAQGFDEYEGIPYSCDMWNYLNPRAKRKMESKGLTDKRPPLPWLKGDKIVAWIDAPLSHALMNDAIAQSCVDFIDRNQEKPFFLYVPFPSTHRPQIVLDDRAQKIKALGCKDVPKYTQIAEIDSCVGKVMKSLKKNGLDTNTFVFFTNDNGNGSAFYKKGLTVPRGGKFGPKYEGNMRMPALAWWPGKIPAGKTNGELLSSIDLFPSLATISGGTVPTDRVIDGKDISKVLMGSASSPNSTIFYGAGGVRQGKWKLVMVSRHKAELYNLEKDYGETNDLAQQHPELVESMKKMLKEHMLKISQAKRPAGKASTAKYLLTDPTGLPTLAELLGREGEKVYDGR